MYKLKKNPVADPGFYRGGFNSQDGAPTYDFAKISQKLHEIAPPPLPLDSPLEPTDFSTFCTMKRTNKIIFKCMSNSNAFCDTVR